MFLCVCLLTDAERYMARVFVARAVARRFHHAQPQQRRRLDVHLNCRHVMYKFHANVLSRVCVNSVYVKRHRRHRHYAGTQRAVYTRPKRNISLDVL